MKYAFLLLLAVTSSLLKGQDQLNTITTAVPFLLISPDARASGLGDAGCASSSNVYSNYWNVSKNSFSAKMNGIAISYTPWLTALVPDINLFELSSYKRFGKKNTIGVSGRYFSLGDIGYTTVTGMPLGQFRPYEYCITASYSRLLSNNFSLGIAGKYIHSNLTGNVAVSGSSTHPGRSSAIDLSCYKRDTINFINGDDVFAWGISIANIGSKISYSDRGKRDFLPQNIRIGASYKLYLHQHHSLELISDVTKLLVPTPPKYAVDSSGNLIKDANGNYVIQSGMDPDRSIINSLLTSFYDAPGGIKEEMNEINISSGIEYWFYKTVAIRAGYFYEHETKGGREYYTAGIGGRYRGVELDIAHLIPIEDRHPLQNTWRVSLSWEFDRICKKKS